MVQVNFNDRVFPTKMQAIAYCKQVFNEIKAKYMKNSTTYRIFECSEYFDFFFNLLDRHKEKETFFREEFTNFLLTKDRFKDTYHIECEYSDTEPMSFSWNRCITLNEKSKLALVKEAMRNSICEQIEKYKLKNPKCIKCDTRKFLEVDHCGDREFRHIAKEFLDLHCGDLKFIKSNKRNLFDSSDELTNKFMLEWNTYHKDNSQLQTLCIKCHKKKTFEQP